MSWDEIARKEKQRIERAERKAKLEAERLQHFVEMRAHNAMLDAVRLVIADEVHPYPTYETSDRTSICEGWMKLCHSKAPVQARTTDNPDRKFEAPKCELAHGHSDDHLATVCDYMVQITWKKADYRGGITGKAR